MDGAAPPPPSRSQHYSSSSSIANFSPISTLQKQYAGRSLLIAVQCSPECCSVGLEDVLKNNINHRISSTIPGASNTPPPSPAGTAVDYNNTAAATETTTSTPDGTSNDEQHQQDPFSFLNESDDAAKAEIPTEYAPTFPSDGTTTTTTKKKPNLGRFLKKVAATSTKAIERGMHTLAVRADQGRSPDCLVLAAYTTEASNELLYVTEAEPRRTDGSSTSSGMQFRIPLTIPHGVTGNLVLKLYIRSGAALVSSKHYLLGTSVTSTPMLLNVPKLQHDLAAQQQKSSTSSSPAALFVKVLLNSPYFVNGSLQCTVLADQKFAARLSSSRGWFLQDPHPATAYDAKMFHLPLDQSYCFPYTLPTTKLLLATERTVESTVVLPVAAAFAQLAATAAKISYQHGDAVRRAVLEHRHDSAPAVSSCTTTTEEYAEINLVVSHFQPMTTNMLKGFTVAVNFQRPNSIFEVEILPATKVPLHPTAAAGFCPDISCRFYPKPVRHRILPAILQQLPGGQLRAGGYLLGRLRIQITVPKQQQQQQGVVVSPVAENPFDPTPPSPAASSSSSLEIWNCIIPLEGLPNDLTSREYPVYNNAGRQMGMIHLSIASQVVTKNTTNNNAAAAAAAQPVSAAGGLVALVGMSNVLTDGILPPLDFDDPGAASTTTPVLTVEQQRRRSQLATMGHFITHAYMDEHMNQVRQKDVELLEERAAAYQAALGAALTPTTTTPQVPAHQDRSPKPFRPSSSRSTMLLSGIGFNVHTESLSLDVLDPSSSSSTAAPGNCLHNITCGAPADHARGFGNVFSSSSSSSKEKGSSSTTTPGSISSFNSPIGPVSGGLRRLKAARRQLAEEITNQQTALVMSIANYFVEQRAAAAASAKQQPVTHVPALHVELQGMRWRVFEAVQCLHHLTWTCAMRQASVFSQALGIAVSSYLSSISDPMKLQSTWPELWARHGFLVSYEGLLSAAGKELGMIEDASVGIDMLRMVRIILVPDDGASHASRVPVPHSTYIKWIHLWTVPTPAPATGQEIEYILQIGMVPSYLEQRIPAPLKGAAGVRLYPLLFEVGVDIFQAASNAGSNMSKNIPSTGDHQSTDGPVVKGGLIEDEDDDVGITDDDVLVQLNYEAFQKMNTYAQSVSPAAPIQATPTHQTHPLLATLFQHITSSSGKMNHDILDEAASLAQQLGGGGVVFCKSGKDRTAMHVTYKQSQFATKFRQHSDPRRGQEQGMGLEDGSTSALSAVDTTLDDAMLIRLYGTRLPICEKNVGQAKYAFNALQVKFMPDALKPPMSALAGFLKGGKVFGGGGIES